MDERVSVTVTRDQGDNLDEVAEQLRAAGMCVDQILGAVGIITGSVPEGQRASLAALSGVATVEAENTFQLAPPGSGIQ